MNYEIRPLSFGEVFDQAFQIFADKLWLLTGIAAVTAVPWGALLAFGHLTHMQIGWLAGEVFNAAWPLAQLAIMFAVANTYLGRPTNVTDSYEPIVPLLLRIGGTLLLVLVLLIVAFIMLVVPGIYCIVAWLLVPQIMTVERRFGFAAIKRSEKLIKPVWWQALGFGLILLVVTQTAQNYAMVWWSISPAVGPLASAVIVSVLWAYFATALSVYYFSRRCEVEGFDLQALAREMDALKVTAAGAMGSSLA